MWKNPALIARDEAPATATSDEARRFAHAMAQRLGLTDDFVIEAYEDPLLLLGSEGRLPVNVDPLTAPMKDADERSRLRRALERGLETPAGFVLPLRPREIQDSPDNTHWESSPWPLKRERLYLLFGDSSVGNRLPLASLPERLPEDIEPEFDRDPFDARGNLHDAHTAAEKKKHALVKPATAQARDVVRTALCVEMRNRRLHVFLPPLKRAEDFLNLVALIEHAAQDLDQRDACSRATRCRRLILGIRHPDRHARSQA